MLAIRPETPADYAAVRDVNERAFERGAEADLVDALRRDARAYLSLVAEKEDRIVGHIFFSPVDVELDSDKEVSVVGLAPMAVLPERQRRGIGTALVRKGLQACQEAGCHAVVVLGHAEYYPRFGFSPAEDYGLQSEYDVPAEAFMALELIPGALHGLRGTVTYDAAFGDVE